MIDFRESKEPTNPLWEYIISVNLVTSSIWQIPYLVYSPSRLQLISSKTAFTRTSFWTTLILLSCLLQEVARNWSLKGGLTSDYVDNNVANKEKKNASSLYDPLQECSWAEKYVFQYLYCWEI